MEEHDGGKPQLACSGCFVKRWDRLGISHGGETGGPKHASPLPNWPTLQLQDELIETHICSSWGWPRGQRQTSITYFILHFLHPSTCLTQPLPTLTQKVNMFALDLPCLVGLCPIFVMFNPFHVRIDTPWHTPITTAVQSPHNCSPPPSHKNQVTCLRSASELPLAPPCHEAQPGARLVASNLSWARWKVFFPRRKFLNNWNYDCVIELIDQNFESRGHFGVSISENSLRIPVIRVVTTSLKSAAATSAASTSRRTRMINNLLRDVGVAKCFLSITSQDTTQKVLI